MLSHLLARASQLLLQLTIQCPFGAEKVFDTRSSFVDTFLAPHLYTRRSCCFRACDSIGIQEHCVPARVFREARTSWTASCEHTLLIALVEFGQFNTASNRREAREGGIWAVEKRDSARGKKCCIRRNFERVRYSDLPLQSSRAR
jgi:hypothetical protein